MDAVDEGLTKNRCMGGTNERQSEARKIGLNDTFTRRINTDNTDNRAISLMKDAMQATGDFLNSQAFSVFGVSFFGSPHSHTPLTIESMDFFDQASC